MLTLEELKRQRIDTIDTKKKKVEKEIVDEYLDAVFENYKELEESYNKLKANEAVLNKQIKTLSEGVQYYKGMETTLQKALILAEKTSKETKDAAKEKARLIEEEAVKKAENILNDAKAEYDAAKARYKDLYEEFSDFRKKLADATKAEVKLLKSDKFELDTPEIFNAKFDSNLEKETKSLSELTSSVSDDSEKKKSVESTEKQDDTKSFEPQKKTEEKKNNDNVMDAPTINLTDTLEKARKIADSGTSSVKEASVVDAFPKKEDASKGKDKKEEKSSNTDKKEEKKSESSPKNSDSSEKPRKSVYEKKEKDGVPTLDSLLQDLNGNNNSSNSGDPFEFLGSIDDDF